MQVRRIARPIARSVATRAGAPSGGGGLGPEMAPSLTDGSWSSALSGFTQDGTGLHFNNTTNGSATHPIDTEDNVVYEITYTLDLTSGSFLWQLYGNTAGHLGRTTEKFVGGTYTERIATNTSGSLNNLLRAVPSTGTGNTFNITALSIKKVLG